MRLALQPRKQCLRFRLFPVRSPLLRESLADFFSSAYLDVSVRQVRFCCLCIQLQMIGYYPYRVPPFGHSRVNASSGSPRLFAGSTSFFACRCQGIHQQPLKAWPKFVSSFRVLNFFLKSLLVRSYSLSLSYDLYRLLCRSQAPHL